MARLIVFSDPDTYHKRLRDDRERHPAALHSSMDKDQKPQSTGEKPPEKKSSPQSGNLVWYMLGLGVLLLLMVTMLNNGGGLKLGFHDLLQLVEVSGKDEATGKAGRGYIDTTDPSSAAPANSDIRTFQRRGGKFHGHRQSDSPTLQARGRRWREQRIGP